MSEVFSEENWNQLTAAWEAWRERQPETKEGRREASKRRDKFLALRKELLEKFAQERGVIVAKTSFTPRQLIGKKRKAPGVLVDRDPFDRGALNFKPYIDHPQYLRHANRPFKAAGIISHTAATQERLDLFAEKLHLTVEPLPWSWDAPELYNAYLITKAGL